MRRVTFLVLIMALSLVLMVKGAAWAAKDTPLVDKDTLKSWLANPQVLIIDVRAGRSWEKSDRKIKGAIRQDPRDASKWAAGLAKEKKIVLY